MSFRSRKKKAERQAKLFEIKSPDILGALTWTCHICKEARPDRYISVVTKPFKFPDSEVTITENVRYCNDRSECIEGAKTYRHFHPERKESDAQSTDHD